MKKSASVFGKIQPVFLLIALFPVGVVSLGIALLSKRQSAIYQPGTKTCAESLEAARRMIAANGGQVDEFTSGEMSPMAVNPFSFNEYATFSLSGTEGTERFMNSSDTQRQIAEDILKSCDTTTKVTFGVNQTDYIITWFRMPNGSVQKGVCREANRNIDYTELPWGEYVCL
ncbi:hypothetical protein [Synechococcus sp. CB0205]|uniref:hypothetical protein n=1 Tax=Synechococcus sp. CB0205 TaxID=232363 RepID=UPI0012EA3A90|nr:hypothetical protein [Synechococcus sp. CB0205]